MFCVLSASEAGFLLVVKLRRNVVMMTAGVKIVQQVKLLLNYRIKKDPYNFYTLLLKIKVIFFVLEERNAFTY